MTKKKARAKSDKPAGHRTNFSNEAVLFGADDEVVPIIFPISDGEKLERSSQLMRLSQRTIHRKAMKFRIYMRSGPNATLFVYLPALSAILAGDWTAYRLMQEGNFDHDRVRLHVHRIQQRAEECHREDVKKAADENAKTEPAIDRKPADQPQLKLVVSKA